MPRNPGLPRNPRPTSAHNTAGTGAGIIIGVAIHHRHYRPYYRSHNYYAPRAYGYSRPYGYYGGGPGVTFSFGSGGYRGW